MLNVRVKRNEDIEGGYCLFAFAQTEPGDPIMPAKLQVDDCAQDAAISFAPAAVLPEDAAQQLFDDLWGAGFRPPSTAQTAEPSGVIEAKDAHLADLREIAGKLLDRIPVIARG